MEAAAMSQRALRDIPTTGTLSYIGIGYNIICYNMRQYAAAEYNIVY